VFLSQKVDQDEVPRTHATINGVSYAGTAVGTDLQRDLFQERSLTYLQYHKTNIDGPFQDLHMSFSWHEQDEDEDRIRNTGQRDVQGFEVGTLGTFLQLGSDAGALGVLTWGFDYYRDWVDSYKYSSIPVPADAIQGPVGDNAYYDLVGVYVQDLLPLGDTVSLTVGARYTYARADADKVRDPSTNTQFAVHESWDQWTGNARLMVELAPDHWQVFGGVTQGFRAPNLSDLTSSGIARSGEVEVAATGLQPEHYLGYEVGTKVRSDDLAMQMAWYYTDIEDQILRFPTGQIDPGTGFPIVTKANVGDGYVQGVELDASWRLRPDATVFGAFGWQYGRVLNFDAGGLTASEEYISRLMPLTTMLGIRFQPVEARWHVETLVLRAEDADKLSAGDQRDTQRIPPGGTPSYTLWNLNVGWAISDQATLDAGVDNITDVDYRVHGSGSNGVGRNFVLGVSVRF
jgi:hemoglobin/transferrin/lactoferrin receptor protein